MATKQKGKIFISYRRADSAGYAGRIYDRLISRFAKSTIFMDVDAIPAGSDFVKILQNEVQACDVLVALIGQQWLNIKDNFGNRRLDDPEDFVRIEIATALERNIRVIPVLLDGVAMPKAVELPNDLQSLATRNAVQINHHSFNADANRLISQLKKALLETKKARKEQEVQEKAEAEERARVVAEKKAKKEREDRERRVAEKKVEKEKKRQAQRASRKQILTNVNKSLSKVLEAGKNFVRNIDIKRLMVGIVVLLAFFILIYGGNYFLKDLPTSNFAVVTVTSTYTQTTIIPVMTSTQMSTPTQSLTPTITPTLTPTLTPTPTLGVGSTKVSEKDGMVLSYIPAGEFMMGSDDSKQLVERPAHKVYLDAFWFDQTEITNALYALCVNEGVCNAPTFYADANYFPNPNYANHPVMLVTWVDANTYCKWVNRRLPTEAQWEKAARGEFALDGKNYSWGDDDPVCIPGELNGAQFRDFNDTCLNRNDRTIEVASFAPNYYGVYDTIGNLAEWVADRYGETYYSESPYDNPTGSISGESRVIRNASWARNKEEVLIYRRAGSHPNESGPEIGFRCAMDAE